MARKVVERTGMKSGWCGFPLKDTKQHQGCKQVFEVRGYSTWECTCECHGDSPKIEQQQEPEQMTPEDRAAATKGK